MSHVWTTAVDQILQEGYWLENIGVRNWAMSRNATLHALSQLKCIESAVLGGDVYFQRPEAVESSYDSWYCDKKSDETQSAFLARSIETARAYVSAYAPTRQDVLFALVPQVVEDEGGGRGRP